MSATLFTKGTTKKVGKKTVYTPKVLVASVTMAGPPSTVRGTNITFHADTDACGHGYFAWSYHPGVLSPGLGDSDLLVSGCGTTTANVTTESPAVEFAINGNTMTWRLRLLDMGRDLPLGSTFKGLYVQSDVNEPVTSIFGTSLLTGVTDIDYAESNNTYELR